MGLSTKGKLNKAGGKGTGKTKPAKKSLHERAVEKVEVRKELKRLEALLEDLKIHYEQFFLGLHPYAPDQLHREVKQLIRKIRKAPFKRPEIRFRQMTLENRYHTYNDYWQRTMREKEAGTYSKDVFKAGMRERHALEDAELGKI